CLQPSSPLRRVLPKRVHMAKRSSAWRSFMTMRHMTSTNTRASNRYSTERVSMDGMPILPYHRRRAPCFRRIKSLRPTHRLQAAEERNSATQTQRPDEIEYYYGAPTPAELSGLVRDAVSWCQQNAATAESQVILIYAWNEIDEGGWLVLSFWPDQGSRRLDAIRAVLRVRWSPFRTKTKPTASLPRSRRQIGATSVRGSLRHRTVSCGVRVMRRRRPRPGLVARCASRWLALGAFVTKASIQRRARAWNIFADLRAWPKT